MLLAPVFAFILPFLVLIKKAAFSALVEFFIAFVVIAMRAIHVFILD